MTEGYKITKKNYSDRLNIWKPQLELAIAQLAIQVEQERGANALEVCRDLNFAYCKKRKNGKLANYIPTKFQRTIISNKGY